MELKKVTVKSFKELLKTNCFANAKFKGYQGFYANNIKDVKFDKFGKSEHIYIIYRDRYIEFLFENGTYSFNVKGDANKIPEEEVVISENILGRVYLIFPGLGKVQFFLASKGGILLAILIPAVAIIGYDIYKIGKGLLLKKRMKELDELEKK